MKKAGLITAALMLLLLLLVLSPPGSQLICSMADSYDSCAKLPICSAINIDTLDGPTWACDPWTAD